MQMWDAPDSTGSRCSTQGVVAESREILRKNPVLIRLCLAEQVGVDPYLAVAQVANQGRVRQLHTGITADLYP